MLPEIGLGLDAVAGEHRNALFEYFTGDHLLVLVATPLLILGLLWFLRATGYGLAARATAENSDRARLLGVRVKRVSLIVWAKGRLLSPG